MINYKTRIKRIMRDDYYFCMLLMNTSAVYILGIESSCDDTSAAITCNDKILSNITAGQQVHELYGGVVPELASRAHQQNIIPVVSQALSEAKITKAQLNAVSFSRGPGLIGSLLVGTSFAKSFGLALGIPIIEVNHMQAHVIANFASRADEKSFTSPSFPFLCLTVSGGHTQIVKVTNHLDMTIIGQTLDDAAGEAFDKAAKMLGLPYPGGPLIDQYAQKGDSLAFKFPVPVVPGLNYSFSGLKTAFLYFIQKQTLLNPKFKEESLNDICASIQYTIVQILLQKLQLAVEQTGIKTVAIAGGVSANSLLRSTLLTMKQKAGWDVFIPKFEYCTDNAGMIAMSGYYKFLANDFASQDIMPVARYPF